MGTGDRDLILRRNVNAVVIDGEVKPVETPST